MLIDTKTDPNSMDTGRRMAKMYINEIMSPVDMIPRSTQSSFPDNIILKVATKVCWLLEVNLRNVSLTPQTVRGVAYIGIIAGPQLLGLSKYIPTPQWCAP